MGTDRIGKFTIHWTPDFWDMEFLLKLQKDLAIIYIEDMRYIAKTVFIALSPKFRVVNSGDIIPEYECIISSNPNEDVIFKEITNV